MLLLPSLPPSLASIHNKTFLRLQNERTNERTSTRLVSCATLHCGPTHSLTHSQRSEIGDWRLTLWWVSEFAVVRSFIRLFAVTQSLSQPAVTHSLSHSLSHSTPLSVSEAFDDRSLTHSLTAHCSLRRCSVGECSLSLTHSLTL